jgi:uncharacterized membrane protein
MADYHFDSTWVVEAPVDSAFDTLRDYEAHPTWWRHVRSTRRADPGNGGIAVRYEIQSPLLYSLSFDVELEQALRPHLILTRASGDLCGTGEWRLGETDGVTTIHHRWNVATTKVWMNAVAPLGRPAFRWAHDRIMEDGARGLAAVLDAELVAFS